MEPKRIKSKQTHGGPTSKCWPKGSRTPPANATTSTDSVFTAMASNPSETNSAAGSVDFTPTGAAVDAANVEGPFSSFFDTVDYSGAFASTGDSWLDGWSYLDCVQVRARTLGTQPRKHLNS